ncbi:MAG: hypothetical protein ABI459_05235 [Deltaproteobacteria bacterium]
MVDHPVAVVTMVRDDIYFLKKWVSYYGDQFGRENLYIINHARELAVAEAAAGCNLIGIPEGDTKKFDIKRWRLLNGFVNGLLGYYSNVIVGDVDEFVVADPAHWTSLTDCLFHHRKAQVISPFGLEVTHLPSRETGDVTDKLLGPRRYAQIASYYAKPCILGDFTKLARGGHFAECDTLTMPKGLYLFHMRYADRTIYSDTMNRRNAVVASTGAQKPTDIMIGRHWFAGYRDDDAVFANFEARAVRSDFGFETQRQTLADSWHRRGDKGNTWQFDELPQTELFELPERLFGVL